MTWFRYLAFVGAVCMLVAVTPGSATLDFLCRIGGAFVLMFGCCYFLLRENEILYGSVCVILAVLVQPIYSLPYSNGMWMLLSLFAGIYLCLAGLLSGKIEKQHAMQKAKIDAEMEMYRRNEEKLRKQKEEMANNQHGHK